MNNEKIKLSYVEEWFITSIRDYCNNECDYYNKISSRADYTDETIKSILSHRMAYENICTFIDNLILRLKMNVPNFDIQKDELNKQKDVLDKILQEINQTTAEIVNATTKSEVAEQQSGFPTSVGQTVEQQEQENSIIPNETLV